MSKKVKSFFFFEAKAYCANTHIVIQSTTKFTAPGKLYASLAAAQDFPHKLTVGVCSACVLELKSKRKPKKNPLTRVYAKEEHKKSCHTNQPNVVYRVKIFRQTECGVKRKNCSLILSVQ